LKPLHPDSSLNPVKLQQIDRLTTEALKQSLLPGQNDSLKVRPDGTMLDGHHRVKILRSRGVDVDTLPREIVDRAEPPQ
jgi:hypothetical protein